MKARRFSNIQALRALGVLLVVGRHIQVYVERATGRPPLLGSFFAGDLGVDLFFVISGCVMAVNRHETLTRAADAGRFLYRRVARIYPLYWVYSLPAVLIYLWHPQWLHRLDHGMPVHLVRSFLLWPQQSWPLLGQAWSLVYEMYFYLAFALLLCLPPRWFLGGLLAWAGTVAASSALLSWWPAFDQPELRLACSILTLEFIAGVLTGLAIRLVPRRRAARWGGLCVGLGGLWILLVVLPLGAPLASWNRVVWYGLPCVALVYGAAVLETAGVRLPRFLTVIGDWSYSIYLSHIFVIAALCRLLPVGPALGWLARASMDVVLVGGVLLAGALSYRFLEAGLLRITPRWRPMPVAENRPMDVYRPV